MHNLLIIHRCTGICDETNKHAPVVVNVNAHSCKTKIFFFFLNIFVLVEDGEQFSHSFFVHSPLFCLTLLFLCFINRILEMYAFLVKTHTETAAVMVYNKEPRSTTANWSSIYWSNIIRFSEKRIWKGDAKHFKDIRESNEYWLLLYFLLEKMFCWKCAINMFFYMFVLKRFFGENILFHAQILIKHTSIDFITILFCPGTVRYRVLWFDWSSVHLRAKNVYNLKIIGRVVG